ncbi:MAG: 1-acyl-sn-glycerol-3-phosphate acyltransferase, partial [Acidobacteriota bacterium]
MLSAKRWAVVGGSEELAARVAAALGAEAGVDPNSTDVLGVVVLPNLADDGGFTPLDDDPAADRLPSAPSAVVSSTVVYGATAAHPGLVPEGAAGLSKAHLRRHPVAGPWLEYEQRWAKQLDLRPDRPWAILRSAPVPTPGGGDFWSRRLGRSLATVPWGHDPPLQMVTPEDLATTLRALLEALGDPDRTDVRRATFNLAPDATAPLRRIHALAGVRTVAAPELPRRGLARLAHGLRLGPEPALLDYLRHPFTASGDALRAIGAPEPSSSAAAARRLAAQGPSIGGTEGVGQDDESYDPFGLDEAFIDRLGRTAFGLLYNRIWRVESQGLDHVPTQGPAVLAGNHRGFVPADAMMTLHAVRRRHRRTVRFLVHPTLLRWPFVAPLIARLGGLVACRENAERVLAGGGLVGILPEGIRGAFTPIRQGYALRKFGRPVYVELALRYGAPIVPFVTVGSAEVLPIWRNLEWRWWQKLSGWPTLPVPAVLPFLPLPLPVKWHTHYLEPILVDGYGPDAWNDRRLVRRIDAEVRRRMNDALEAILARRPGRFRGSALDAPDPRP